MNNILREYLNKLNNNHMDDLLSKYKEVIIYDNEKDIELGLLRFKEPPKGKAFLFKFPKEEILDFHTVGMNFPINIYFFNSKKEIVFSYSSVSPGIDHISSKGQSKYVVEIP